MYLVQCSPSTPRCRPMAVWGDHESLSPGGASRTVASMVERAHQTATRGRSPFGVSQGSLGCANFKASRCCFALPDWCYVEIGERFGPQSRPYIGTRGKTVQSRRRGCSGSMIQVAGGLMLAATY
eukprot:g49671.t1